MSTPSECLQGQRFARLQVIGRSLARPKETHVFWDCVCDCGSTTRARSSDLRRSRRTSCGCYFRAAAEGAKLAPRVCKDCGVERAAVLFKRTTVKGQGGKASDRCQLCFDQAEITRKAAQREKLRAERKTRKVDPITRRKWAKNYRDHNPDRYVEHQRRYQNMTKKGLAHRLFKQARRRASQRGLEFSLTDEWILERFEANVCEATGIPFQRTEERRKGAYFYTPSIDRIQNDQGYTEENCRVVIWGYNAAKGAAADADVMAMALALVQKAQQQNDNATPVQKAVWRKAPREHANEGVPLS